MDQQSLDIPFDRLEPFNPFDVRPVIELPKQPRHKQTGILSMNHYSAPALFAAAFANGTAKPAKPNHTLGPACRRCRGCQGAKYNTRAVKGRAER